MTSRAILRGTLAILGAWLVGSACGTRAPSLTAEQERGRVLYTQYCAQCHGPAANGTGELAPPHGPGGHTWHHPDKDIIDTVLGRLNYPGRTMPSFQGQLTEEEVLALLAYLKINWTPEQRKFQEAVTRDPTLPPPPRQRP